MDTTHINPYDEKDLQGDSEKQVINALAVECSFFVIDLFQCRIDIGRQYDNKKQDQQPTRVNPEVWNKKAKSSKNLKNAS